jgi:bis(5'-nucleosidyl)-tetraphosphatase
MELTMEHQYSAGVITYTMDNDQIVYLILRYGAGHWDFPKGHIEAGETQQDAAHRELYEETGLTAELDSTFTDSFSYIFHGHNKELIQKTVYFFLGQAAHKSVKLSHEHIDYQWLTYKEALEKLTYDNAKNILKKAHRHLIKEKTQDKS